MAITVRANSKDRLPTFPNTTHAARKTTSDLTNFDDLSSPPLHQQSRRRSNSLNRLSALLLGCKNQSSPSPVGDHANPNESTRGRTSLQRLAKSRPLSLTRSPVSEVSSSRSAGHPPSSFRMRTDTARMSSSSILDTLDPPQPFYLEDEAISRSSSPSAGWRPRSTSRAGSINEPSRPASRMSLDAENVFDLRTSSPPMPSKRDATRKSKRKSKFFTSSRSKNEVDEVHRPSAWIAGDLNKAQCDLKPLTHAERVLDLWDEKGGRSFAHHTLLSLTKAYADTYVYLFPRAFGRGPSFRVHSSTFASSTLLTELACGGHKVDSTSSTKKIVSKPYQMYASGKSCLYTAHLTPQNGPDDSSSTRSSRATTRSINVDEELPQQMSLYLPITLSIDGVDVAAPTDDLPLTQDDLDELINIRNLFAFLVGGALVATRRRYTFLSIFLAISRTLKDFNFTNIDSTTFGEIASTTFDCYVDELNLADVRPSCEKIIEGVILGERMKSVLLYNEAFVHAVGRYDEIQSVARERSILQKFLLISRITRARMERAYHDLQQRRKTTETRLVDFDFPSLFIGSEGRLFKDDFGATRRHVMDYYKTRYGSWPPRANFKKNGLRTNGLNRLVLKEMYQDFSEMYNLYVDRTSFTTRVMHLVIAGEEDEKPNDAIAQRLRSIFDQYDRSMPPIQPPIPFDVPLLPISTPARGYGKDAKADMKSRSKRIKDDDVVPVLEDSRNKDVGSSVSPFLTALCKFERKEARGRNIGDVANLRASIWIFAYVVIQALPMLALDVPGVRYTQGVEYFLCEPPRKGLPWAFDAEGGGRGRQSMAWYEITGGSGMVSLPSDLIEHGVEGIYRRSHCWLMAKKWSASLVAHSPDVPNSLPMQLQRNPTVNLEDEFSGRDRVESSDNLVSPSPVSRSIANGSTTTLGGANQAMAIPLSSPLGVLKASSAAIPSRSDSHQGRRVHVSRRRKEAMRESVIGLGLAELPLPQSTASSTAYTVSQRPGLGLPRPLSETVRSTGMTFDDIIAGMEKDKKANTKGQSSTR